MSELSARKYRILVVDDEPAVLFTYQMILAKQGYEVLAASSSEAARRALDNRQPDLLICDLSLGEKDSGFEVIEYARNRRPELPSLLLTGYGGDDISSRARRLGISVLFKPTDVQQLLSTVRAHLSGLSRVESGKRQ